MTNAEASTRGKGSGWGDQVRVGPGFQVQVDRVAGRRELGEQRAHGQLEGEHRTDGDVCPGAASRRELEQRPCPGGEAEREHDEAERVRECEQRHAEPQERPSGEPTHRVARRQRVVAEALDAHRPEHRHGDHGEVAHAPGVVQVDVAEGDAQEDVADPGRRDDRVEHQDPGERERTTERPHQGAAPARLSASGTLSRIVAPA